MEAAVKCIQEVWQCREYCLKTIEFSGTTGYGHIQQFDLQPLHAFIASSERYYTHLECFELLSCFKLEVAQVLKVLKLSELLTVSTLTLSHLDKMKSLIKPVGQSKLKIDLLFSRDSKATVTPQRIFQETNIP